jgi:hypothetical protein
VQVEPFHDEWQYYAVITPNKLAALQPKYLDVACLAGRCRAVQHGAGPAAGQFMYLLLTS